MGKTQPSFQHEVFGSFCLSGCLFRRSGDLPQRCCGPSRHTRGCSCQSCSPWTTWTCPPRWLCWISLCCLPLCRWIPHGLVAHANGAVVPVDEPAVYAAKVAHAAAGGVVNPVGVHGYAYGYAGLVAHPNGAVVPVEPYEVVAARAAHLAAVAAA